MSTAWMIRNDGTAFPCVCHTYGNWDAEEIEETLFAAQWLYEHTAKDATRKLCMELIYSWAAQLSTEETSLVETIYRMIDSRPYRFLSREFISAHAEELKVPVYVQSLESLNEDLNMELNQEFLRARYGGLYDTDPASREMFFRISSTAFDWYPILIWKGLCAGSGNFWRKRNVRTATVTGSCWKSGCRTKRGTMSAPTFTLWRGEKSTILKREAECSRLSGIFPATPFWKVQT